MAPPRALKKYTLQTPSAAATRQSARQSQKQAIDEAEDFDDHDSANNASDNEETGEEEAETSQNTSDGPLEHLMTKMVDDERKRHDMSKKSVNIAYNKSKEQIEQSINAVFDTHEAEALAAHQAQLKRLRDLFDQKAKIETAMRNQLASLQKIYDAHSRDLETVLDRRIKDMK